MACRARPDHNGFRLHTQAGRQIEADAVFMTTGHAPQAVTCSDGKHVAIDGLGLSAMDSIAALTEGRGGRYIRDGSLSGWRYRASGREPQIYLFSRSGLPFHCRPQWRPPTVAPQRLYFTAQAIGALRTSAHKSSHNAQLDFKEKVLPLIKDEMRAAFYLAQARLRSPERMEQVRQRLLGAASPEARRAAFDIMAASFGPFEPEDYLNVRGWEGNSAHYRQWFQQWVTADLARSRLGAQVCPFTQALEVWRDCRDVLRLAADHHGLTDESTLEFYGTWAALSNRLVGGPQKERYEDLLALIEAGVVRPLPPMQINSHQTGMRLTALDPACDQTIEIDGLICARNAHSGLTQNRSALIDDLLSQGLIKQAHPYPADGIDVDEHSRALRRDGAVNERLWVLGPAVEGCTFYNHYVPTPDPLCKAPLDARSAVEVCLGQLDSCVSRFALANGA
jgi:hypothetical protein